jgi:hypothetical protein
VSGGVPEGFAFERRGDEVVITHRGKPATTLRGDAAARFLEEVGDSNGQDVMARVTGNYKRGNERAAKRHPRNR